MPLKADDGSPLEVKEGTILSSDSEPEKNKDQNFYRKITTIRAGGWLTPVFILALGAILSLGLLVFLLFTGAFIGIWVIRHFFKILKS